ncbi:MAG: hypothetical protein ABTA16_00055 [Niallia sp.]
MLNKQDILSDLEATTNYSYEYLKSLSDTELISLYEKKGGRQNDKIRRN